MEKIKIISYKEIKKQAQEMIEALEENISREKEQEIEEVERLIRELEKKNNIRDLIINN